MSKIPLLLQPAWLALRNRWLKHIDLRTQSGRDIFLLLFSFLVIGAIYYFTSWSLSKANENPSLAFVPPSSFLGMILLLLLAMLLISSMLAALGTFYLSEDLDLILAAPIKPLRFFSGRFIYVYVVSAWMPFLFATPVLVAFGKVYGGGWDYYLCLPFLLIPYFLIPTLLGSAFATITILLVPVYRVRETALVLLTAFMIAAYMVLDILRLDWNALRSAEEVLRLIALTSTPQLSWMPSFWVSTILEELLRPNGREWLPYAVLLFSATIAVGCLSYLVNVGLHDFAYSNIRNKRHGKTVSSKGFQQFLRIAGFKLNPQFRALLGKELRVLSRDVSQAVQLFFLLGLCLLYLYHLRIFSAVESFPEHIRPWWKNFLFMGNVVMGSFITTAVCTRFVYPSLSLEGRSFWVLQTSPMNLRSLLRAKFWCWFFPVAVLSTLFFTAGTLAIGADLWVVALSAAASVVVCYGVVGLAIGFGAHFAHFEWEHASQLAGGFGSLLFMLGATFLIFLNMIPAWILLFYRINDADQNIYWMYGLVGINAGAILLFNVYGAHLVLKSGAEALERRMSL